MEPRHIEHFLTQNTGILFDQLKFVHPTCPRYTPAVGTAVAKASRKGVRLMATKAPGSRKRRIRSLWLRFGVQGLGSEVWGLGFKVWGLGFKVWGLGFGI